MLDPAFSSLRAEAAEALQSFDANGCPGFDSFAQQHRGAFALVDENGKTVCGNTSLSAQEQLPSTTEIYGRQLGQDTVWTLPVVSAKGERFRFLVSVHRERHTWYGDLMHFAFPQLLVAVAVGGLTTFVLVMIFTRPVINLREAARHLSMGRLSARAKENKKVWAFNSDEFGALVHDFNHTRSLEPPMGKHELLKALNPIVADTKLTRMQLCDAVDRMTAHTGQVRHTNVTLATLVDERHPRDSFFVSIET